MEASDSSVPLAAPPYDALRQGLKTFDDRLLEKHAVQRIQATDETEETFRAQREVCGMALSARMHMERQILEKRARLPPLTSSGLGSDIYFGRSLIFTSESYLGLEEFSEKVPVDTHSQMEQIYGLATKPVERGIL